LTDLDGVVKGMLAVERQLVRGTMPRTFFRAVSAAAALWAERRAFAVHDRHVRLKLNATTSWHVKSKLFIWGPRKHMEVQ
jgi:hypothetical protein